MHADQPLSIDALAAAPRWDPARLRALPGRARGSLLRDWAAHLTRRWGADAVDRVREASGVTPAQLPEVPDTSAWYPVHVQLALTRAVADVFAGGDLLALEALLLEDGQRVRDKVVRWAMRAAGPKRVLAGAPKLHPHLYDVGAVDVVAGRDHATLRWTGAELFAEPVWRVLQMFAARSMVRVVGRSEPTRLVGFDAGPDAFRVELAW